MSRDVGQLFSWRPLSRPEDWLELEPDTFRPTAIAATFHLDPTNLLVEVTATGDKDGVRVTAITGFRHVGVELSQPADVQVSRSLRHAAAPFVLLGGKDDAIKAEHLARFDPDAAAATLAEATTLRYLSGGSGARDRWISFGGGPFHHVSDVRSYAMVDMGRGADKPGPKRKVPLEQVATEWRKATKSRLPAARTVAERLGVSIATAHRYIALARKAGLIKEDR